MKLENQRLLEEQRKRKKEEEERYKAPLPPQNGNPGMGIFGGGGGIQGFKPGPVNRNQGIGGQQGGFGAVGANPIRTAPTLPPHPTGASRAVPGQSSGLNQPPLYRQHTAPPVQGSGLSNLTNIANRGQPPIYGHSQTLGGSRAAPGLPPQPTNPTNNYIPTHGSAMMPNRLQNLQNNYTGINHNNNNRMNLHSSNHPNSNPIPSNLPMNQISNTIGGIGGGGQGGVNLIGLARQQSLGANPLPAHNTLNQAPAPSSFEAFQRNQQLEKEEQMARKKREEEEKLNRIKQELQNELESVKREAEEAVRQRDQSQQILENLMEEFNLKVQQEKEYRERLQRAMDNTKPPPRVSKGPGGRGLGESSQSGKPVALRIYGIKGSSEYYENLAESIALECQTKFVPYQSSRFSELKDGNEGGKGAKKGGKGKGKAPPVLDSNLYGLLDDGSEIFRKIAQKSYGKLLMANSSAAGMIKTSKDMIPPDNHVAGGAGLDSESSNPELNHEKIFGDIEKIMNDYYQKKVDRASDH